MMEGGPVAALPCSERARSAAKVWSDLSPLFRAFSPSMISHLFKVLEKEAPKPRKNFEQFEEPGLSIFRRIALKSRLCVQIPTRARAAKSDRRD
jgi:hypothetical protein